MPLHPQIVELMAAMDRPDRPRIHELPIGDARLVYGAMPTFLGALASDGAASREDRTVPGPHGEIPVRVHRPVGGVADDAAIVVFYHGGGFCIGDLDTHGRECDAISAATGATVVSVDYRMGPEHSFTAGMDRPVWVDDSWAAFEWVADHAGELGGRDDRLVVCGDSAGGNIAAVMAQMARDAGRPLALQVLIYPATDVRDEAYDLYPSYAEHAEAPILERVVLEYFKANSRPDGDGENVYMSPGLNENLADLAPAVVVTAEYDPLRDDGEAYAERLAAAGVTVSVTRYEGMPHGFFTMGPLIDAAADVVAEVATAIGSVGAVDSVVAD